MAEQEQIWQVDEHDTPIGPVGRDDSRRQGLRYRMVRVSVEEPGGLILIQKRAAAKKSYPNCWDTAAGGNSNYPETYEQAARRELSEEIGLVTDDLEEVAYFYGEHVDPQGAKMNRFTKVYRAVVPKDTQFTLQESEVSETKWVTRQELLKIAETGNVTDGLQQTIQRYYAV